MKITDSEKLILLMLSDIYEKLGIDGEVDPEFIRLAILSERTWSIPWKCAGIPFEHQETPAVVREVLDILDMWSAIERGYENCSKEEKDWVEKEAEPFGKDPKFNGFDGNTEFEYVGTVSILVNELDRYPEFKGRDFNSHFQIVDSYRRMHSVYKTVTKDLDFHPLSAQSIIDILNGRRHPDRR